MNIDDLSKFIEIMKNFSSENNQSDCADNPKGLQTFVGKKVIVRTYSAGVHFGELVEKHGNEVILKNSRRLYYWKNINNEISISEIAINGLHKDSKVCAEVDNWFEAIEIIPCTETAIKNIESQDVYKA